MTADKAEADEAVARARAEGRSYEKKTPADCRRMRAALSEILSADLRDGGTRARQIAHAALGEEPAP